MLHFRRRGELILYVDNINSKFFRYNELSFVTRHVLIAFMYFIYYVICAQSVTI